MLKCDPLLTPLFGPKKLISKVKELNRLNSLHITILAQVSFDFYTAKQQSSKLNISEFSLNSLQQFKKEGDGG